MKYIVFIILFSPVFLMFLISLSECFCYFHNLYQHHFTSTNSDHYMKPSLLEANSQFGFGFVGGHDLKFSIPAWLAFSICLTSILFLSSTLYLTSKIEKPSTIINNEY